MRLKEGPGFFFGKFGLLSGACLAHKSVVVPTRESISLVVLATRSVT